MTVPEGSIGRVLVGPDELAARVRELGAEITQDYAGRSPLLVGVLKGAFVFMSDLAREIGLPVEIDFMAVSSYGASTKSSGVVRIVKDLDLDVAGRDVLLVEDIVDSGSTLRYLLRFLEERRPASLRVCASCSYATAPAPTRSNMSASRSPTTSWSATGSTSPSATANSTP